MALTNLSILVLILFFFFAVAANATRNLRHVSPAAAPISIDHPYPAFINPIPTVNSPLCSLAERPMLCQYLVDTYHPKTPVQLRDASIKEAIRKAKIAKTKSNLMAHQHKDDKFVQRRIKGCTTAFDDVATTLKDAQDYYKDGDDKQGDYLANTVISLLETCHDVFDYNNEDVDYPTKRLYFNLNKILMNMMSVLH